MAIPVALNTIHQPQFPACISNLMSSKLIGPNVYSTTGYGHAHTAQTGHAQNQHLDIPDLLLLVLVRLCIHPDRLFKKKKKKALIWLLSNCGDGFANI